MTLFLCLSNFLLCEALQALMRREGYQDIVAVTDPLDTAGKPDLVLLDSRNLERDLFALWPDAKFLLLDTGIDLHDMVGLMRCYKLDGILSTDTNFELFKRALLVISRGEIWIDNVKLKALLRSDDAHPGTVKIERLSGREKQIVEKIAQGFRNREIASELFLSEQTVKSHVNRIFRKMRVTSRSQLISLVMKNNILGTPQ